MKYFPAIIIMLLFFACKKTIKQNKILFITTSVDKMNDHPNGTYLVELAVPFEFFTKNGFEIDIVSPKGDEIPIYHSGDTTEIIKNIITSELFKQKTKNSLIPHEVKSEEYAAIIIPGGYGQFWDIHSNIEIQKLIAKIYESGGVIGSLGHGTAMLIDVKLRSGEYLVKNKTLTSFPTWNEKNIMKQSDFGKLLPYDMEKELLGRGAYLKIYNHEKGINYEVVDANNRLVTASFSSSGEFVAQKVLKLTSGLQKEK